MAIYRFRVIFEDYDEVLREVDVLSTHTFLHLHKIIQQSTGYNAEVPSSFYISNEQWMKGEEIAYLPTERKLERGVLLMENAKLSRYIDDPHQKFYYTYNFDRPFDFHVQLIKILKEESGKSYPSVFKTVGTAPKPFGSSVLPAADAAESEEKDYPKEEFDFLNEMEYGTDDTEDMDLMDDEESSESENDDFSGEFGDNDKYEEDY
ncbi:IS1096 element passenger TnpR family protein [Olivibacter sitiensis]|uniref:IS1096 element passenger TnpR family protein n=1 Tax=Olivibacter sitiensis TaxID=376470 RepID=UPI00040D25F1|nr:hypothetical protein [Olivibacter sitiensis]